MDLSRDGYNGVFGGQGAARVPVLDRHFDSRPRPSVQSPPFYGQRETASRSSCGDERVWHGGSCAPIRLAAEPLS